MPGMQDDCASGTNCRTCCAVSNCLGAVEYAPTVHRWKQREDRHGLNSDRRHYRSPGTDKPACGVHVHRACGGRLTRRGDHYRRPESIELLGSIVWRRLSDLQFIEGVRQGLTVSAAWGGLAEGVARRVDALDWRITRSLSSAQSSAFPICRVCRSCFTQGSRMAGRAMRLPRFRLPSGARCGVSGKCQ